MNEARSLVIGWCWWVNIDIGWCWWVNIDELLMEQGVWANDEPQEEAGETASCCCSSSSASG